jgi:hypothetical protein
MYREGEEMTKEVIFTRLLKALCCYSDDDVFVHFYQFKARILRLL